MGMGVPLDSSLGLDPLLRDQTRTTKKVVLELAGLSDWRGSETWPALMGIPVGTSLFINKPWGTVLHGLRDCG